MDLLKTMQSYVRVVRTGSFAAAADQLNVSRAIVSKHIQNLETHLSARLLNRSTRSLSLTEIGKSYYDFCVRILMQIEEKRASVAGLQTQPRGSIVVMAPKSFGNMFVGAAVADFVITYPQINVTLLLQDGSSTSRDLIQKGVDLAIRISPVADTSMIAKQIGALRWIACAAPSYLAAHGEPRTLDDLAAHKCLVHLKSAPDCVWTFDGPAGRTGVKVIPSFAANSSLALRSAAIRGIGIAMLPLYSISADLASGDLVEVLPDFQGPERPIIALYPHRPLLLTKVRLLTDFLAKRFKEPPVDGTAHRRRATARVDARKQQNSVSPSNRARQRKPLRAFGLSRHAG
jgi:DNA-binding transcriptional LysR family regulator